MATPTFEMRGDVHIPLCGKERCKEQLVKLAKALEKENLTCVVGTKIMGKYERSFLEAFENCSYTIVHRCRRLWDKISIFESNFCHSDNDIKVIAVNLFVKSRSRDNLVRSPSGLDVFFDKFSENDISMEKSFNNFVSDVVKLFHGHPKLPQDMTGQQLQKEALNLLQDSDTAEESENIFKPYPDMFGNNSRVFLKENCVKCTASETAQCFSTEEWSKWQKHKKLTPQQMYVVHTILPELYSGQKVIELAYIACSCETALQEEAVILLENFLLSRKSDDRQFSFSTQVHLETLLFHMLTLESDQPDTLTENKSSSVFTERLSILYVMNLSDMISSCRTKIDIKHCSIYLHTIAARNGTFQKAVQHLNIFIEEAIQKPCYQMKAIISKCMTPDTANLEDILCNENSVIQACVITELMKQIFKTLNVELLKLLHVYVVSENNKASDNKKIPPISLILLVRSITIFLSFGLKNMKHQNLQEVYQESLMIIKACSKWTLTEDMYRFLQTLLFNNSLVIQKDIFKSKCNVGGCKKSSYDKNPLPFLTNQLEKLLSPLLIMGKNEMDKPNHKTENTTQDKPEYQTENAKVQWKLMKAQFNGNDALVRVHIPDVTSHREKNDSGCTDDLYCNEMKVLQKLQHRNIIKMFAFQESHVPLFYVMEDIQINLQTALKHKRDNQDVYQQTSLLKFLIDAITAVDYCHTELHVHCNLTCESLIIVNDNMAKLCGFHLCLELVDGRGKLDKKNSKKEAIPTRWTAPESLQETEYTTASDVWMFGHLMYEVLTHGQLPYSQIEKIDDVSKKIVAGSIILPERPCFKKEHYNLICSCIAFNPLKRCSVKEIKHQLNQFLHGLDKTPSSYASDYSFDSSHKQSTESEKGLPNLPSSKYFEDQNPCDGVTPIALSDTLTRFTAKDKYIFREKIAHKITHNMEIKVEGGKLSDILPGIHIYQHPDEAHHIECHVPKSCQGSLLELVFERTLGQSLKPYIECLLQVASMLKRLHESSWILGDVCASSLYLECTDQGYKVYVVSLSYLLLCEMGDERSNPPENTNICARAAPEVIDGGIFSSGSDIYCFGHLIWEVLTAFDHLQENLEHFMIHMESSNTTRYEQYVQKVSEKWEESHARPQCCSDDLFDLILSCTVSASVRRITLDELIHRLRRICEKLPGESTMEHSADSTA